MKSTQLYSIVHCIAYKYSVYSSSITLLQLRSSTVGVEKYHNVEGHTGDAKADGSYVEDDGAALEALVTSSRGFTALLSKLLCLFLKQNCYTA